MINADREQVSEVDSDNATREKHDGYGEKREIYDKL